MNTDTGEIKLFKAGEILKPPWVPCSLPNPDCKACGGTGSILYDISKDYGNRAERRRAMKAGLPTHKYFPCPECSGRVVQVRQPNAVVNMNKCKKCGYERKQPKRVKGSGCPKCGYRPTGLLGRLRKAWKAFNEDETIYRPRKAKFVAVDLQTYGAAPGVLGIAVGAASATPRKPCPFAETQYSIDGAPAAIVCQLKEDKCEETDWMNCNTAKCELEKKHNDQ